MNIQTKESAIVTQIGDSSLLHASAANLLRKGERLPLGVCEIIRYCAENDVPVTFTRNEPAGSCLDASRKRVRCNGHVGIELRDELKSLVCAYTDIKKQKRVVALHCRGDQNIDFKKASIVLAGLAGKKTRFSLLDELTLTKIYQLCFGIVNPALLDIRSHGELLQLFDAGLLETPPTHRMMTNAGDHTWGMEFDVGRLVHAVGAHIVGPICK